MAYMSQFKTSHPTSKPLARQLAKAELSQPRPQRFGWWIGLLTMLMLFSQATLADGRVQCIQAALQAAQAHGVPWQIMVGIVLVESSARPTALNIDGTPVFADSLAQAEQIALAAHQDGANIDAGCFQISSRWHGPDYYRWLDPDRSAEYAAAYLRNLLDRHHTWREAVARYHSGDPDRGVAYVRRVAIVIRKYFENF
jgi:hypothetical protein